MATENGTGTSLLARARTAGARALRSIRDLVRRPAVQLPPSPFQDWAFDDAAKSIERVVAAQTIDTTADAVGLIGTAQGEMVYPNPRGHQNPIAINRSFYQGDHYQGGSGWIGPHPAPNDEGAQDMMNEIALCFTSKNATKEVTTRHRDGVVGRPWQWGFTPRRELAADEEPTEQEQALIAEVTAIVRPWLKARKIAKLIGDAIITLLLSERAAVRLEVPAGLAEEGPDGMLMVNAATIEDALAKIWPAHPDPEHASVIVDGDTRLECGTWLYETVADEGTDAEKRTQWAGLCYLDEAGETIIRLVPKAEDGDATLKPIESTLSLGQRITMFEMRRTALISLQVQQAQRALNLAETMVPRNVITGGFLERLILDGQMPGEPELDENNQKTGRWIAKPFYAGAGTTNFISGKDIEQNDGTLIHASPSVYRGEPVPPDASISASDKHYYDILDEVSQLHVIANASAEASGKSREQMRAEFLRTLTETQPEAEAAIAFVIETALAMAEALAKTPGKYTSVLRAQVSCKLDAGPLSAEERTAIEASIGKTISQQTAMGLLNVEDIEGERARILSDPLARANLGKIIGEALTALTTPGASLKGAALFLGIDGEQLTALLTPGDDVEDEEDSEDPDDEPEDSPSREKKRLARPPEQKRLPRPARPSSSSGTSAGGGAS